MKLSSISMMNRPAFRGYEYVKDNFGNTCYYFNFPHDTGDVEAKENAKKNNTEYNGYKEKCVLQILKLDKDLKISAPPIEIEVPENGVAVDMGKLGFKPNEKFGYRYKINGETKYRHDIGKKYGDYNVVSLSALKPTVNGSGYLLMPDGFAPGYVYKGFTEKNPDDIGEIILDKNKRKQAEESRRTFSNSFDGNLAGMQAKIPYLKDRGIKVVFGTPITGGDSISAFKYWPENLFQLAGGIGNINNFEDYMSELYKSGMVFVFDAPLTSEGIGGIHYQYALKWGDTDNQMKHWFRMEGIESDQIGYGVVGTNSDGLSHYLVNAPHNFETLPDGQIKYTANMHYDPKKPTYIQNFDKDYVSTESVDKKELLEHFDKTSIDNPLKTGTHDDTIVNFHYIINKADYEAYLRNIEKLNELNKNSDTPITMDSKEGTIFLSNLPRTKLTEKKEAGVVTWDANTDMIKLKYFDSAYDYKSDNTVSVDAYGMTASNYEIQDMSIKSGMYWTKKVADIQSLYTAQKIGTVEDAYEGKQKIDKLIQNGTLPKEANMELEALENIDLDLYNLEIPEVTEKTLVDKIIMNLSLESLELSKDTLGVLSTSYFTARATSRSQLGMSRYDLAQQGNPQFTNELNEKYGYKKVYEKVNDMLTGEVYDFVHAVLERVNEEMPEDRKIFTDSSNSILTEYGYYVTKFVAEDAAKYILIKAFAPKTEAKTNSKGQIIYDYETLKEDSSLAKLGVLGYTPKYEAELLAKAIHSGLKEFGTDAEEIDFVKEAVLNRISNTNANSFKYAEAITDKAGLGANWRIDALKDMEDIDSLRNKKGRPDIVNRNLRNFWRGYKDGVAKYNPASHIFDEITDRDDFNGGNMAVVEDFIDASEHTSEAAYDYFFTDIMKIFSGDPAKESNKDSKSQYFGGDTLDGAAGTQKVIDEKLKSLALKGTPLEYTRSLYTFGGNHDKPRLAHCMMVDMKLMHANLNALPANNPHRNDAILMVTGAASMNDLPYDVLYNLKDTSYINKNYLLGASTYAIANGKVIRDNLHEFLGQKGVVNQEELAALHRAVTALVNGNYTIEPEKRASYINYDTAIEEVLNIAETNGLNLRKDNQFDVKSELINAITKKAKEAAMWEYNQGKLYSFQKYYQSSGNIPNKILVLGNLLREAAEVKLKDLDNHYKNQGGANPYYNASEMLNKIDLAIKEYMKKYDSSYLTNEEIQHQEYLLDRNDNERNTFGGSDIREAIRLVFEKAGLGAKTEAQFKLYKVINDPVMAKLRMYMRILASVPGIPTIYGGDEFGMGGYEEKAKNVFLQNRNATPFSKLEGDSEEAKYYKQMNEDFAYISNLRNSDGVLSTLNTGTPYYVSPQHGKNESNGGIVLPTAFTMDSAGSMVLSLFNMAGISPQNKYVYDSKAENPYIPKTQTVTLSQIDLTSEDPSILGVGGIALTSGLILSNIISGDNSIYKVVKNGVNYCIQRFIKEGNHLKKIDIVLDNGTMRDGVFTIYHKVKNSKIHFKGGHKEYFNPQYNIVSNPYHYIEETNTCGEKLSIVSK